MVSKGNHDMRVTITTDGGFTGRGLGNATADVDGHYDPGAWQERYTAPGADLVTYTLEADGRRVTWVTGAEIPADLRELFERVWRERKTPGRS
jgi:hypothetical protein